MHTTCSIHWRAVPRGVLTLACFFAGLLFVSPATAGPLRTAALDPAITSPSQARAISRTHAMGATMVRVLLNWRTVAPASRPPDFVPEDPADPRYEWTGFDNLMSALTQAGLDPIVSIQYAPRWAEGTSQGDPGTGQPDPVEFGRFARAAATRYSGRFIPITDPYSEQYNEPLPRVRYWMAWNEPNRDYFFMPQYENGRLVSPAYYRAMVNRFADGVHAVDATNIVVAGGLAPIGKPGKPAPLTFMRSFLSAPVKFDVWSHHPYTSGGPTHHALKRDDVSLGDLPDMRRVLRSAIRAGRVVNSSGSAGFWVTEFSWDSNPPDPRGVNSWLHARWVAEALFRMWSNGVSVVTWFRIQDDPLSSSPYQSGFYRTDGRAKASLKAFRFPVVAFRKRGGIYVWGRTPAGESGRIGIEIKLGRRWRPLGSLNTDRWGIFRRTYRTPVRRGYVRARFGAERSLPFSLTPVADRYVNPFGCGGAIPC
jgi:hypothetical protein